MEELTLLIAPHTALANTSSVTPMAHRKTERAEMVLQHEQGICRPR